MIARQRELKAEEYATLESCPHFDACGEQDCPLDALNDVRVFGPGENGCRARRSTRLRLGTSLPRKGLTRREWASTLKFHGSWEQYLTHQHESVNEGVVS
jgi:hypothetical protein